MSPLSLFSIKSIEGTTNENDEFLLEGHILYKSFVHSWKSSEDTINMVVIANSLRYAKWQSDVPTSVRFGITNFDYFGNKFREYPNGGGAWDILSFILGNKTLEIHEVQDHKVIMESVRAQRGIDVTSEVVVNISSLDDLNTVIPLIDMSITTIFDPPLTTYFDPPG